MEGFESFFEGASIMSTGSFVARTKELSHKLSCRTVGFELLV